MDVTPIKTYLINLQNKICSELQAIENSQNFATDTWQRAEGGGGISRVLENGEVIERGGVNFSHVFGTTLPPSASASRPELAGRSFQALGISLVIHPRNPKAPTVHMNVRFFIAEKENEAPVWWFGGGYDLTPYYGYIEDCVHWHQNAKKACVPFGEHLYPQYKKWCDDYFYIKHRQEARGIGGIFFDDVNQFDFDTCFNFIKSVGDSFLTGYKPILVKRKDEPYTDQQKDFQCYRRGRYVEFNLVYDRGTLFGLQSNGRTESILMSLPPVVHYRYDWQPSLGSDEERLMNFFLPPKDWVKMTTLEKWN